MIESGSLLSAGWDVDERKAFPSSWVFSDSGVMDDREYQLGELCSEGPDVNESRGAESIEVKKLTRKDASRMVSVRKD